MEIRTQKNRVTEIFQESENSWTATVTLDETRAQVFNFKHEPTPDECDEYADNFLIREAEMKRAMEEENGTT